MISLTLFQSFLVLVYGIDGALREQRTHAPICLFFFQKSFCDEVSDELRFTVRCFGGSKKSLKRSPTKEVMDNGIRFTNLPGFKDEKGQKVIYT